MSAVVPIDLCELSRSKEKIGAKYLAGQLKRDDLRISSARLKRIEDRNVAVTLTECQRTKPILLMLKKEAINMINNRGAGGLKRAANQKKTEHRPASSQGQLKTTDTMEIKCNEVRDLVCVAKNMIPPLGEVVDLPATLNCLQPPAHLQGLQRDCWNEVAACAKNIYDKDCEMMLAAFCVQYARFLTADEKVKERGLIILNKRGRHA